MHSDLRSRRNKNPEYLTYMFNNLTNHHYTEIHYTKVKNIYIHINVLPFSSVDTLVVYCSSAKSVFGNPSNLLGVYLSVFLTT